METDTQNSDGSIEEANSGSSMEAENNSSSDDSDHHSTRSRSRRGSKRRKQEKGALNLDRISDLPNPLLLHILSFLPTKYAARTSVLSKQWQYMWTSTPILDFHDSRDIRHYKASKEHLKSFVSCINRTLILNKSPKLEKFRVHMYYKKGLGFDSDVDVWLRFATSKNVEELDLNFSFKVHSDDHYSSTDEDDDDFESDHDVDVYDELQRYFLPMNMFSNCSSLTKLKLGNCDIYHGRVIYWKSLKVLSLSRMWLNDSFIRGMLWGCPSLELLELINCWNYEFLDIKSERLRKLVIRECEPSPLDDALPLKISAPYLQSLDIEGYLYNYSIINSSSSLVDAKLDFYLPMGSLDLNGSHDTKILVQLLENLRHVKDLTMGILCLQVLSMLEEESLLCPLSSVVCLRVNTSLYERDLPGMTRLLRHTPLVETLIINFSVATFHLMHIESEFLGDLCGENYWSSQKGSFASALLNLKTVRIIGFGASKTEVELLFFLLKSASMLEKMIIHALDIKTVSLKRSLEVAQRLLSFPRCSQDAVVLFA